MLPIKEYIMHPRLAFLGLLSRCAKYISNDKLYLQMRYYLEFGKRLNLENPMTFNEKLQWLKLYNRNPEYTMMVDKYAVKEYVSSLIGEKYIIPTIGIWDYPENIEWKKLPNKFVLKTTHGGGSSAVIVCKNINAFDKNAAITKLSNAMKSDIYKNLREWPYKNVCKRIIAEVCLEEKVDDLVSVDLTDYKFYCFNGEPKLCQVIRDRNTKETIDFYDINWEHLEVVGLIPNVKNGENINNGQKPVNRPIHLNEMIDICRKLSGNIPFLRVDLYVINNKIYFGELTFFPASGFGCFRPDEWSRKLGDLIILP